MKCTECTIVGILNFDKEMSDMSIRADKKKSPWNIYFIDIKRAYKKTACQLKNVQISQCKE